MSKSRVPLILGLTAASAGGYYLYTAGGDPKVAKQEIKHDASRASTAIKDELPGRGKEAKEKGEVYAQKAAGKFDSAVGDAKAKLDRAGDKASAYGREVGAETQRKIDQVDRKVEEGAAKAKSGVSGWFGGK